MKKLIVVGAGETARLATVYFAESGRHVSAYAVDRRSEPDQFYMGAPVVEIDDLQEGFLASEFEAFVAVGSSGMNADRERLCAKMLELGYELTTCVSPKALIASDVRVEPNAFIMEGCIVQSGASVGEGATLWCGVVVAHKTIVGSYSWLAPSVAIGGASQIGARCFVGVGASIGDNVKTGQGNLIGAGSVVTKSISESNCAFTGNPLVKLDDNVYRRFA